MCELLGLNSNVPTAATFSFSGLSARGGRTGDHADGWRMAFHDGEGCRVFLDEGRACDAPLADFLRRQPLRARTVIAHVRKATQGAIDLSNCHPFQREWLGRHWLFCHNGDLGAFRPPLDGGALPVGGTDSEWAFCWLLAQLRRRFATAPEWPELAPVLAELMPQLAAHGVFNMLLTDGKALYAHASTRLSWVQRHHPFARARLVDCDMEIDLSTANAPSDRMVVVATRPLTVGESWQAFEPGELRVFASGQNVWHRQTAATETKDELAAA